MNENYFEKNKEPVEKIGHVYDKSWYDFLAEDRDNIWDQLTDSGLYVFEMLNFHLISETLRRCLPPPALVADMACGRGPLSVTLKERGYQVVGCDFSLKALRSFDKQARELHIPRLTSDLFCPPFKPGCFDAVVFSNVIEHLQDPRPALQQLKDLLKPEGFLVLATPYREDLASRVNICPRCRYRFNPNGHFHSFDENSLSGLLGGSGFLVKKWFRYRSPATEILWSALGGLSFGAWTMFTDRIFNCLYPSKAKQMIMLAGLA